MIIILRNAEHNTEAEVRISTLPHTLTADQMARARATLGGEISGPQTGPDGRRLHYRIDEDGNIRIIGRIYECRRCHIQGQSLRSDRIWCSGKCRMAALRADKERAMTCEP